MSDNPSTLKKRVADILDRDFTGNPALRGLAAAQLIDLIRGDDATATIPTTPETKIEKRCRTCAAREKPAECISRYDNTPKTMIYHCWKDPSEPKEVAAPPSEK